MNWEIGFGYAGWWDELDGWVMVALSMFSIVIAGEGEKESEGGGIFDLADEGVKA